MEYATLAWAGEAKCAPPATRQRAKAGLDSHWPINTAKSPRQKVYVWSLLPLQASVYARTTAAHRHGPPASIPSATPRTRCQHQALAGHSHRLTQSLPASSPDFIRRCFLHFGLDIWNKLPNDVLPAPPSLKGLPIFKRKACQHLIRSDWLWANDIYQRPNLSA